MTCSGQRWEAIIRWPSILPQKLLGQGVGLGGNHLTPPTPHPTTGSRPQGLPISDCKVQSRPMLSGLKVLQATFIESLLAFSNILIRAISEVCLNSLSLFV